MIILAINIFRIMLVHSSQKEDGRLSFEVQLISEKYSISNLCQ
jgi:hypothetical protein